MGCVPDGMPGTDAAVRGAASVGINVLAGGRAAFISSMVGTAVVECAAWGSIRSALGDCGSISAVLRVAEFEGAIENGAVIEKGVCVAAGRRDTGKTPLSDSVVIVGGIVSAFERSLGSRSSLDGGIAGIALARRGGNSLSDCGSRFVFETEGIAVLARSLAIVLGNSNRDAGEFADGIGLGLPAMSSASTKLPVTELPVTAGEPMGSAFLAGIRAGGFSPGISVVLLGPLVQA